MKTMFNSNTPRIMLRAVYRLLKVANEEKHQQAERSKMKPSKDERVLPGPILIWSDLNPGSQCSLQCRSGGVREQYSADQILSPPHT